MTDQTKLREAVARAIDPSAFTPSSHDKKVLDQIAQTTAVYSDGSMPRAVLTFEEAKRIFSYMTGDRADEMRNHLEASSACRAAMSGGEKK